MKMDINSDMGESFGAWRMGDDAALLDVVTSANVACSFHAGDPAGMLDTLRTAAQRGVAVGAHVAYRDLAGLGHRRCPHQRSREPGHQPFHVAHVVSRCRSDPACRRSVRQGI